MSNLFGQGLRGVQNPSTADPSTFPLVKGFKIDADDNLLLSNVDIDNFKAGVIETTLTDSDEKLPTSGAVFEALSDKVVGTVPSVEHAITRYADDTGLLIEDSKVTISDVGDVLAEGNIEGVNLTASGDLTIETILGATKLGTDATGKVFAITETVKDHQFKVVLAANQTSATVVHGLNISFDKLSETTRLIEVSDATTSWSFDSVKIKEGTDDNECILDWGTPLSENDIIYGKLEALTLI